MKTTISLAILTLLSALTSLDYLGNDRDAQRTTRALSEIAAVRLANVELNRDVLNARLGMLRNYDPMNDAIAHLHSEAAAVAGEHIDDREVNALKNVIDEQERLVESFKTSNALLQNALTYFGLATNRIGQLAPSSAAVPRSESRSPLTLPPAPHDMLDAAVATLATAMLQLTLDTGASSVEQVDRSLRSVASVPVSGDVRDLAEGLLAHGRLLLDLLPNIERLMISIHQTPIFAHVVKLRHIALAQQEQSAIRAGRYRVGLYAVSLILVAVLAAVGMHLVRHIHALRRRISFEHAIGRLSARFVSVSPNELDAAVVGALRDVAVLIGADRGYAFGAILGQPVVWGEAARPTWSVDRATRIAEVAAFLDTDNDGMVFVPCVRRLMAAGGPKLHETEMRGWVCMSDNCFRLHSLTIGFETSTRAMNLQQAELGMLRLALVTLASVVRRLRLVADQAELEKQLEGARRMETVGAITSGIAHNFNNIIGAILGYAEIESEGPSSRFSENVMGIQIAAERGRDLISQILNYGRQRTGWAPDVDADALLGETVSLLGASLPHDITVHLSGAPVSARIAGNGADLQQVILNLCTNAAQAIEGSDRIINVAVKVIHVGRACRLREGELSEGDHLRISVSDRGRGMDTSTMSRLFEPFFTTRPSGSGLGLATVREIVRAHAGAIDVASEVGHGSRFEVWLPLAKLPLAEDPSCPQATTNDYVATVLILSPEASRLMASEDLVAALGYEPVGFAGGPDEVDAFSRLSPGRFDAVLVAPGGSSDEIMALASTARQVLPYLPLLVAVSSDDVSPNMLATIGVTAVLIKPLSSCGLAAALSRALGKGRNASAGHMRYANNTGVTSCIV